MPEVVVRSCAGNSFNIGRQNSLPIGRAAASPANRDKSIMQAGALDRKREDTLPRLRSTGAATARSRFLGAGEMEEVAVTAVKSFGNAESNAPSRAPRLQAAPAAGIAVGALPTDTARIRHLAPGDDRHAFAAGVRHGGSRGWRKITGWVTPSFQPARGSSVQACPD